MGKLSRASADSYLAHLHPMPEGQCGTSVIVRYSSITEESFTAARDPKRVTRWAGPNFILSVAEMIQHE
jgi:hypothetical protein